MNKRGIDISEFQGNLTINDFIDIKNSGIEFVIIRCGYTGYGKAKNKREDRYFENNYNLAKQVGISVGTYYYSCATTMEEAEEEANFVLNIIKDKTFEYPIVIDTEDNHDISNPNYASESQFSIGSNRLTSVIIKFCDILEQAGYYVSIYASTYWFRNQLILSDLRPYDKWIAQWSETVSFPESYGIWQYSSTGFVNGITDYVDLDYSYKNYEQIMINNNLNGFVMDEDLPDNPQDEPEDSRDDNDSPEETNNNIFIRIFNSIRNVFRSFFNLFR